jgi:two-component system OmpR family response regulator
VDDDDEVRFIIGEILTDRGYRVSLANGGADMRALLSAGDPVDLVILDWVMPGEASISLAAHAHSLGVPVVRISGSFDAMLVAETNGEQLLEKPFKMDELLAAIRLGLGSMTDAVKKRDKHP